MILTKSEIKEYLILKKKLKAENRVICLVWLITIFCLVLSFNELPLGSLLAGSICGLFIVQSILLNRRATKDTLDLLDRLVTSEPENVKAVATIKH